MSKLNPKKIPAMDRYSPRVMRMYPQAYCNTPVLRHGFVGCWALMLSFDKAVALS